MSATVENQAAPATATDPRQRTQVELAGAGVVMVVGMAMTTVGAFGHVPTLMAPGSALILGGSAWLGNVLARRDVHLFARFQPQAEGSPAGEG
jgi:hypothetical protein